METLIEDPSNNPVCIDTQMTGFPVDPVALLEHSLAFHFYEGKETHHAFPHTTGWRILPFSVFTCPLEHSGVIQIEDSPPVAVGPGDAYLIPAGMRHRSDVPHPQGIRCRWLHFTFRLLGGLDLFALVNPLLRIPSHFVEEGRTVLTALLDCYTLPCANPLELVARRRQAEARFLLFLLKVCPLKPDFAELLSCSQRVQPALVYLHEHYADEISRDDLVQRTGLSRTTFHRLFHRLTGSGPSAYLKHRRLQVAQLLLLTTNDAIHDIAHAVGYADAFHFTRQFTATIGCSPRIFRQTATPITTTASRPAGE